jgi:hypothetical protein
VLGSKDEEFEGFMKWVCEEERAREVEEEKVIFLL